jgi:hypothetical protein
MVATGKSPPTFDSKTDRRTSTRDRRVDRRRLLNTRYGRQTDQVASDKSESDDESDDVISMRFISVSVNNIIVV